MSNQLPRYSYHLSPKQQGCCCVTHDEIRRVAGLLGEPFSVWPFVRSDKLVDPVSLESKETRITLYDRRKVKREYLRSVVELYGKDKKKLWAMGFLPA
jgi:hypothetical protein